jgi:subtilisin family serine protease
MTKRELRALHKLIGPRRKRSPRSGNDNKKEKSTSEKSPKKKRIVKCKDHSEDKCKSELEAAGTTIVHDIKGTKYFSVLVDEEEELTIGALNDVEGMENDPKRSLSYIDEEEEESVSSSHHRALEQIVPTGVDLVRARELWDQFGSKGEGVKICVVDTGIRYTHEDFNQTNIFGSPNDDPETAWVRTN